MQAYYHDTSTRLQGWCPGIIHQEDRRRHRHRYRHRHRHRHRHHHHRHRRYHHQQHHRYHQRHHRHRHYHDRRRRRRRRRHLTSSCVHPAGRQWVIFQCGKNSTHNYACTLTLEWDLTLQPRLNVVSQPIVFRCSADAIQLPSADIQAVTQPIVFRCSDLHASGPLP